MRVFERLERWPKVGAKSLRGELAGLHRITATMDRTAHVKLDGRDYVIVPRDEFDRLVSLARVGEMPSVPGADAEGNFAALAYGRASIAREIVRRRALLGMSQRALASEAGIRFETLCRIETGKSSPNSATMTKIDRALVRGEKTAERTAKSARSKKRGRRAS